MSVESGGMGAAAGIGGIGVGSIGAGPSMGFGSGGFEGGAGSGSPGFSAAVGVAEIGPSPSFGTAFSEIGSPTNSVSGVETAGMPFAPFSLDTSMPSSEAPFSMSDYQTLWSANSSFEMPSSPAIAGPTESLTQFPGSTVVSEAESLDGLFADIGNFMNQNPVATEPSQSVLSDVDAFLGIGTDVRLDGEVAAHEAEGFSNVPLSAAEQASLLGLITRIEHFSPENENQGQTEHNASVSTNPEFAFGTSTEAKPVPLDFVAKKTEYQNADIDTPVAESAKRIGQVLSRVEVVKEVQSIDYEAANLAPAASVASETNSTEEGKEVAIAMTQEEIEADREQVARVLGIINDLEQEADKADAVVLATIAGSIEHKVTGSVSREAVAAEVTPRPEPMVGLAYPEVQQEQTEEAAVSTEAEPEAQAIADTAGTGTEEIVIATVEEDEPDEKIQPPEPTDVEFGQDHRKNQYRTDRIVEAVKEVKEAAEERFAKQGIIVNVTEVEGDAVADQLSYLQADDDAISEIVPEDEKDGSIAVLLHEMRDETFRVNAEYDKAQVLSVQNTAVKVGRPPATKPEIEKVLFIAEQHNQQLAA